jgi:hypothetical protein
MVSERNDEHRAFNCRELTEPPASLWGSPTLSVPDKPRKNGTDDHFSGSRLSNTSDNSLSVEA